MELVLFIFLSGYIVQDIGSVILLLRINKLKSIDGLSMQSQVMYMLGTIMRAIYTTDTRLYHLWIVWVEMAVALTLHLLLFIQFYKYKYTQTADTQSTLISWKTIIPICMVLSYFFHPGAPDEYMQSLVSLSMFIEASGLLPQIYVNRKQGSVEYQLGKYLMFMGLSRLVRMCFWFAMYNLGDTNTELIIADLLHTILLADFAVLFFKNRNNESILII